MGINIVESVWCHIFTGDMWPQGVRIHQPARTEHETPGPQVLSTGSVTLPCVGSIRQHCDGQLHRKL